jgi:hypothetical protein
MCSTHWILKDELLTCIYKSFSSSAFSKSSGVSTDKIICKYFMIAASLLQFFKAFVFRVGDFIVTSYALPFTVSCDLSIASYLHNLNMNERQAYE